MPDEISRGEHIIAGSLFVHLTVLRIFATVMGLFLDAGPMIASRRWCCYLQLFGEGGGVRADPDALYLRWLHCELISLPLVLECYVRRCCDGPI